MLCCYTPRDRISTILRPVSIYNPLQTSDPTDNHNHVSIVWYFSRDIN